MTQQFEQESQDQVWQLLKRADGVSVREGFAQDLSTLATSLRQEEAPPSSLYSLFVSAPGSWRTAAAAVVFLSVSFASLALLSQPDTQSFAAKISAEEFELASNDSPEAAPADFLLPIEEALASEELDAVLGVDDPESLEEEDLLILLFPDWELL